MLIALKILIISTLYFTRHVICIIKYNLFLVISQQKILVNC
jgi:hypothetical protein